MKTQTSPTFAAVLAAGGRGSRFSGGDQSGVAKQFISLHGTPIYVWSLTTLLAVPEIGQVVIVAPADAQEALKTDVLAIQDRFPDKALHVVQGGDTRQASVYLGLKALKMNSPDYVLVHDAARPFLTEDLVRRVISGVTAFGAITTGIKPADTIKKVDGDLVAETLIRDELLLVQTPQAAHYDWLIESHESAERNSLATTDDAAVLELAGHRVGIVSGATYNIKITQPEDLILAEALASIVFADRL